MEKNRMKTNRIAALIMIVLCFTQMVKTEPTLPCPALCALKCLRATFKAICFLTCCSKCPAMSPSTYNCVSKCGVNKFITVNIGIYPLITLIFVYCFYGL